MAKNLELKVVLTAIDKMTAPLRGIQKQMGMTKTGFKQDMGQLNGVLKSTKSALQEVQKQQKALEKAGKPVSAALIQSEQNYLRKIEETNKAIDVRKRKMNEEMAIIHKRQAALSRGKDQFRSGAIKVATATGLTYAGAKFMQPEFDFDEQMSKVQALTRLDKNDPMFAKLREQAEYLGATTWASATQAADAQAFYAMAGFTPEAIMDALPSTLDLAKAGDVDVGRAADIGSNILSAFGLDPSEMDKVADILVSVFTRTNTSIEMLGDTMKYVGPVARELKIPLEDATAMAGILGNVGIQGTQAGTAMRALQSRLAAPPAGAKKALEELQVSTKDTLGNFRSMPDILADIMKATADMGNADKLGYLKAIAGEEAGSAFAAFVDKNSFEELLKVIEAANNSQGESSKVAKTMSDNLKGDWVGLMSAIESVQIALSGLEGGPMRKIIQSITKIVQSTSNWIKENPKLASGLLKAGAIITGIIGGLGALSMAMGVFNMVVMANPIVFIIGAIIAAIVALIYFKDEIWEFFKTFFTAPMTYINKAIDFLDGLYETIVNFIGDIPVIGPLLKVMFEIASAPIRLVWELIKLIFKGFEWLGTKWGTIKGWLVAIWAPVGAVIKPVIEWIGGVISGFMNMISYEGSIWGFFKSFLDAPSKYIKAAIEWLAGIHEKVKNFLIDLPVVGPLFEAFFTVTEKAASLLLKGFNLIIAGIKYIWDNIGNVGKIFADSWKGVKVAMQPVIDLFDSILGLINTLITKVAEFFSFETPEWIKDISGWVGDKWNSATSSVQEFFGGASLTPARPVSNDNRTNNLTINVETKSNASAAVIASETVNALHSSGLIGDLR